MNTQSKMIYIEGSIYKLTSDQTDDIYIGSTEKTLEHRLKEHKANYKSWSNGKRDYVSSFKIVQYDDCKITLLEFSDFESKEDLRKLEGQYIKNNECVNIRIAGRSQKEYYNINRDEILEKQKEYYDDNRNDILKKCKEYRENNREKIIEYKREYYEKNKEKLNKKIVCDCGGSYLLRTKKRHEKSNKHQNYINNLK